MTSTSVNVRLPAPAALWYKEYHTALSMQSPGQTAVNHPVFCTGKITSLSSLHEVQEIPANCFSGAVRCCHKRSHKGLESTPRLCPAGIRISCDTGSWPVKVSSRKLRSFDYFPQKSVFVSYLQHCVRGDSRKRSTK